MLSSSESSGLSDGELILPLEQNIQFTSILELNPVLELNIAFSPQDFLVVSPQTWQGDPFSFFIGKNLSFHFNWEALCPGLSSFTLITAKMVICDTWPALDGQTNSFLDMPGVFVSI